MITDDPILQGIIISGVIVLFIGILIALSPGYDRDKIAMDNLIAWNHSSNFSCNMGCYNMGMETIPGFNDSNAGHDKFAECSNYCLETFGDGSTNFLESIPQRR